MTSIPPAVARGRLQEHFDKSGNTTAKWEELWKDDFAPWDRGQASPALFDFLKERKETLGESAQKQDDGSVQRKRALVPGCGRGYEVLMLAQFGYDAVGLDGAETAIEQARKLVKEKFVDLPAEGPTCGKGKCEFVVGDFFDTAWEAHDGNNSKAGYDLIYDYTFFCALPPSLRPSWAKRMSEILAPDGRLICLEFPLYKSPKDGGPPFALREQTYVQHLSRPGDTVDYDDNGFVVIRNGKAPKGLVRLDRWLAKRTHEAGQGTDHISIWSHG